MRAALFAALALALLAGRASAAGAIADVRAAASATTATVTWTTPSATRGRVAFGVGGLYLYSERESAPTRSHSLVLRDLSPATTYRFRIESAGAQAAGSLTTAVRPSAPRFDVSGARVTVDGSLFFPVFAYEQCAQTVDRALALGVNTFVQVPYTGCTEPATVTPPYLLGDDYASGRGAGWYLPDEPETWGIAPDELPSLAPAADTGRLRVLSVSQHFYREQAPLNDHFDREDYKRYAARADVIGFDLYPIVKFCGRVSLLDVYRAQRELASTYAPGKPTFQWIETSAMTGECPSLQITPEIVNAETWLAVAGGACGIGYFTNSWTRGSWSRWDFDPGVEQQVASTVAAVQGLAPALCTPVGDVLVPWDGGVAATSRTLNGALYVIAVNSNAYATTVPFRVDELAGRTLAVLDEGRRIEPAKKVYFRDRFAPYQVHVYVAAPADGVR